MKIMKAWYVYEGKPEWYHATLLLENGAAPYGHLCSHPCFMPGDLWVHRPERQRQMMRAGITLDIQNNGGPVHIETLPELIALNKSNKEAIEAFYALLDSHASDPVQAA